ncbi:unnamed protein product [Prorocentrum cordatum]|uniref:Uncharacterized protein n=1 Tax=Prorocentrum cordatum TaxID=2364126 RepID=A0ABN9W9E1_9DINO|nr:unnamed protein product [Polarella glacialis]
MVEPLPLLARGRPPPPPPPGGRASAAATRQGCGAAPGRCAPLRAQRAGRPGVGQPRPRDRASRGEDETRPHQAASAKGPWPGDLVDDLDVLIDEEAEAEEGARPTGETANTLRGIATRYKVLVKKGEFGEAYGHLMWGIGERQRLEGGEGVQRLLQAVELEFLSTVFLVIFLLSITGFFILTREQPPPEAVAQASAAAGAVSQAAAPAEAVSQAAAAAGAGN